jgi:2'-hydroxyisoflavone reductase
MKILILGGTGFIGRHLTELALAGGHEVSLFNRGRTGADLFPAAELLIGDRLGDFESLQGQHWDVAFDIASNYPRMTRLSSEVLANAVDSYVLISTMALYAGYMRI